MTQWEYRFVLFHVKYEGGERHVIKVDEKLLEGWAAGETPTIADYARTLGEEGWEMVFYNPSEAVFKRAKNTDPAPVSYSQRVY